MLWQVRALLEDRPGGMAAVATLCGESEVNILGMQIFPNVDGGVVDEFVLSAPAGWTALEVAQLFNVAGVGEPLVSACSPEVLEDQPVRYVRAAQVVMRQPETLERELCALLDAVPDDGRPGFDRLVLDRGLGPRVRLQRRAAFTDTEIARAIVLRRCAAAGDDETEPLPPEPAAPGVRPATLADAPALRAMHARCGPTTLRRRSRTPLEDLGETAVDDLLEPAEGWSLVMASAAEIHGIATVTTSRWREPHLGLLVEDAHQREGVGVALLRAAAMEASARGFEALSFRVHQDNRAVLPTVHRAGLRAHVTSTDGLMAVRIPVLGLRTRPTSPVA